MPRRAVNTLRMSSSVVEYTKLSLLKRTQPTL
jgi:hypothetical protein